MNHLNASEQEESNADADEAKRLAGDVVWSLSPRDRAHAWRLAYVFSLEQVPDREVAWEAVIWRRLSTLGAAQICDQVLRERREAGLSLEAGAFPADLDLLWQRIDQMRAFQLVSSEGISLLEAMRTVFWLGGRSENEA